MPPAARTVAKNKPAETIEDHSRDVDSDGVPGGTEMCVEHFPVGWKSAAIKYTEDRLGHPQPSVTCEHGTYYRPVTKSASAGDSDEVAALKARIAELEASAPKANEKPAE